MADMVETKKEITFKWIDEERKVSTYFRLPVEVVEKFFQGETLELTFYKESGRIDVKQKRKSNIIQV